jgi:hypothetical protein
MRASAEMMANPAGTPRHDGAHDANREFACGTTDPDVQDWSL